MILLRFLMFIVMIAALAFVVTQIFIPLVTRTTLFPMFRRERTALLKQIQEAKAQLDDEELKVTLSNLQAQLKAKQENKS